MGQTYTHTEDRRAYAERQGFCPGASQICHSSTPPLLEDVTVISVVLSYSKPSRRSEKACIVNFGDFSPRKSAQSGRTLALAMMGLWFQRAAGSAVMCARVPVLSGSGGAVAAAVDMKAAET